MIHNGPKHAIGRNELIDYKQDMAWLVHSSRAHNMESAKARCGLGPKIRKVIMIYNYMCVYPFSFVFCVCVCEHTGI